MQAIPCTTHPTAEDHLHTTYGPGSKGRGRGDQEQVCALNQASPPTHSSEVQPLACKCVDLVSFMQPAGLAWAYLAQKDSVRRTIRRRDCR